MHQKLAIPSVLDEAAQAKRAVMADVNAQEYDKDTVFAVRLALDEALTNAIRHGNQEDPSKQVMIEYDVTPDKVTITVEDEGSGFDPNNVADPTADENLERPHGRGIMLIRAYMTDVSFNDRGNRVTMVKERDCRLPNE